MHSSNYDDWLADEDSKTRANSYYEEKEEADKIKADRAEEY